MGKTFLSFLGTNNYLECRYRIDNNKPVTTRYTQIAIISNHYSEIDQYIFFLTADAKEKNWEGKEKLHCKLTRLFPDIDHKIKAIDIPEGFNNQQLQDIFIEIVDHIDENSELIVDVTHSYRSLQMNLSAALNYLKIVKNISICHIYYGAFESLGPINKVKNMPVEKRNVQILDITYLSLIQDWSVAIDNLIKFGNIDRLKYLSDNAIKPILKDTKGRDEIASSINSIVIALDNLLKGLYTCRFKELKQVDFSKLNEKLSYVSDNNNIIPQLNEPFKKLKDRLAIINTERDLIYNILQLVRWCIDFNWIQQGYTILQENTLSYILKNLIGEENYSDKSNREAASGSINLVISNIPESQWKGDKEKIKEYVTILKKKMETAGEQITRLFNVYCQISEFRNDINHAGYRVNATTPEKLKTHLKNFYSEIEELID